LTGSKIVDIHPHIIADDVATYPLAPVAGVRSEWSATRAVSFEQLVAEMDEAGVDKAAIVHSSTTYGFDNSYVADCVTRMPERFTGVYAIDVLQPDAVATFDYWLTRGMGGIRLFTGGKTRQTAGEWLVDPRTYAVWERAAELGMTIVIQTTPAGLWMIVELLQRFPGVNIALDHLARPAVEDGPPYQAADDLFALSRYENLFLKLTPTACTKIRSGNATPETFLPLLVSAFGADHIAFGSNYPASAGPLADLVAEMKACLGCLSEVDQNWIMSRTAQALYPALAD
jgi:predicted TIM-barrel fold metal-dependent hydrolase